MHTSSAPDRRPTQAILERLQMRLNDTTSPRASGPLKDFPAPLPRTFRTVRSTIGSMMRRTSRHRFRLASPTPLRGRKFRGQHGRKHRAKCVIQSFAPGSMVKLFAPELRAMERAARTRLRLPSSANHAPFKTRRFAATKVIIGWRCRCARRDRARAANAWLLSAPLACK